MQMFRAVSGKIQMFLKSDLLLDADTQTTLTDFPLNLLSTGWSFMLKATGNNGRREFMFC